MRHLHFKQWSLAKTIVDGRDCAEGLWIRTSMYQEIVPRRPGTRCVTAVLGKAGYDAGGWVSEGSRKLVLCWSVSPRVSDAKRNAGKIGYGRDREEFMDLAASQPPYLRTGTKS